MSTGAWVLLAALVVAVGLGLWRRRTDGRFRSSVPEGTAPVPEEREERARHEGPPATDSVLAGTPFATELGERATLLQFSSAFCAPCRMTRRVLGEVVEVVPGVAHVEVDAEQHLDLVRRVGILRTPTTLVLDARGREVTRAGGAPSRQQVLAALEGAIA